VIVDFKNPYNIINTAVILIIFLLSQITGKLFIDLYPDINEYLEIIIILTWTFFMNSSFLLYIKIIMEKNNYLIKNELKLYIVKKDLLLGFLASFASIIPLTVIVLLLDLDSTSMSTSIIETLVRGSHNLTLIFLFFYISFFAPFVEEFLFRGYFWKTFEDWKINRFIILLLTSLLFGLFHLELKEFPVYFTLGLFFGFLRMRTERIGASVVAHLIKNFIGFLSIYSSL